ncbi:MAG: hypothetical protein RIQ56_434 [Candidatus Parcubacteria bacterium]
MKFFLAILVALALISPATTFSQELVLDTVLILKAKVIEASESKTEIIPGTQTPHSIQILVAEILEGPKAGEKVTFENDYTQLSRGDTFYIRHTSNEIDGTNMYSVSDPYRIPVIIFLATIFCILIFAVGRGPGLRGFLSLVGSIFLIFLILVPGILKGISPILLTTSVAGFIIILGSFVTHGFNRTTSAAVIGMLCTVALTSGLTYWAIGAAHLSGFSSDESAYLNLSTPGGIDLVGILFGGILIGLLGVLYDVAIGQAIAVEELFRAGKDLTRRYVFSRAMRMGREHIGALVNTLAIAYVGASLSLLLLVQSSTVGLAVMINSEIFATEIIRTLVGSIGLILAVPITTAISSWMLDGTSTSEGGHVHSHLH